MSKKQNPLKSVRVKLFMTLSLVILLIIIFLILVNNFVLGRFYLYSKRQTLKSVYRTVNDYYNNDLSLSEIAENNNITRQAVRDILKKGENKLFEYEEKLLVMKRTLNQEKQIQQILTQLSKIEETASDKKIEKILNNIRKELICLN